MNSHLPNIKCPLCDSDTKEVLTPENDKRHYHFCDNCQLITTDPIYHLSTNEEKARYQQHNNGVEKPGYTSFLNRIVDPAFAFIKPGMAGLDYGCGPAPTLSKLVKGRGVTCYDYDPLFGFKMPDCQFDFIFSTECFEHFHNPKREIKHIKSLLKPGGYLFIMTEMYDHLSRFYTWYYKRDLTHVCFYHKDTFKYIQSAYGFTEQANDGRRAIILQDNS